MIIPGTDVNEWLRKLPESAEPGLLRETVWSFTETLMSADADEVWRPAWDGVTVSGEPAEWVSDPQVGHRGWAP